MQDASARVRAPQTCRALNGIKQTLVKTLQLVSRTGNKSHIRIKNSIKYIPD